MGELSGRDAEKKKGSYQKTLNKAMSKVEKNFKDMDFENADKRNEMEEAMEEIRRVYNASINYIDSLNFE